MAVEMNDIIRKVEGLLALGTSSNEHEAASAVAKAQDLMLKYGLTLERVQGKAKAADVNETDHFDVFERGKPTEWKMNVLREVARTSGVWIVQRSRSELVESKHAKYGSRYATYRTAFFVGLPMDIAVARNAYEFLVAEIERLAKEYAAGHWQAIRDIAKRDGISVHSAERQYTWSTGTHPLKAQASWTKGAAQGVIEMLNIEHRKRMAGAGLEGNELVLNREAIIRDYWYVKQYGKTYDQYMAEMKERNAKWAAEHPDAVAKPMTPAQLRKLNERNERLARKAREKADRDYWRAVDKLDLTAFGAGLTTGRSIRVGTTAIDRPKD